MYSYINVVKRSETEGRADRDQYAGTQIDKSELLKASDTYITVQYELPAREFHSITDIKSNFKLNKNTDIVTSSKMHQLRFFCRRL